MSNIKNYGTCPFVPYSERNNMSQNRRESDSAFAALFPDSMVVAKKNSVSKLNKFPHTKERKRFARLLTAHAYIRDHMIINPILTHRKDISIGDEWILEWIKEEQG